MSGSLNIEQDIRNSPQGAPGYVEDIVIPIGDWLLADGASPAVGSGNVRRKAVTGTLIGLEWQAGATTADRIVWPGMLPGQFCRGSNQSGYKPVAHLLAIAKVTGTDQPALALNATVNWVNTAHNDRFEPIDTPGETAVQTLDAAISLDLTPAVSAYGGGGPAASSIAGAVEKYRLFRWRLPDAMLNTVLSQTRRSRLSPWAVFQPSLAPSATLTGGTLIHLISTGLCIARNASYNVPYFRTQQQ
jgi:hypothetical protein